MGDAVSERRLYDLLTSLTSKANVLRKENASLDDAIETLQARLSSLQETVCVLHAGLDSSHRACH